MGKKRDDPRLDSLLTKDCPVDLSAASSSIQQLSIEPSLKPTTNDVNRPSPTQSTAQHTQNGVREPLDTETKLPYRQDSACLDPMAANRCSPPSSRRRLSRPKANLEPVEQLRQRSQQGARAPAHLPGCVQVPPADLADCEPPLYPWTSFVNEKDTGRGNFLAATTKEWWWTVGAKHLSHRWEYRLLTGHIWQGSRSTVMYVPFTIVMWTTSGGK